MSVCRGYIAEVTQTQEIFRESLASVDMDAYDRAVTAEERGADTPLLDFVESADDLFWHKAAVFDETARVWRPTAVISTDDHIRSLPDNPAGYFYLTGGSSPAGVRPLDDSTVILLPDPTNSGPAADAERLLDASCHYFSSLQRLINRGATTDRLASAPPVGRESRKLLGLGDGFIRSQQAGMPAPPGVTMPNQRLTSHRQWLPPRGPAREIGG